MPICMKTKLTKPLRIISLSLSLFIFAHYAILHTQAQISFNSQLQTASSAIQGDEVVVIYNSSIPQSQKLAYYYAEARNIPITQVIGLELPNDQDITHQDYQTKLVKPLSKSFTTNSWWSKPKFDKKNLSNICRIKLIVCIKGVPLRLKNIEQRKFVGKEWLEQTSSSLDSELSLLRLANYELKGLLNNPYFKAIPSIFNRNILTMVGRIDAIDWHDCYRMIDDAIAVEKKGLWGAVAIDTNGPKSAVKAGNGWLNNIYQQSLKLGMPSIIHPHKDVYSTNYPLSPDTVLYFGWYSGSLNGPFLNPDFKLKQGAIGSHLYSWSASNFKIGSKAWTPSLIKKGAAAALGNAHEPYLQFTHHYDLFYERLLTGASFIESAYYSMPALSWQAVAIGDPLYRPFAKNARYLSPASSSAIPYKHLREIAQTRSIAEQIQELRNLCDLHPSYPLYSEQLGLLIQSQETSKTINPEAQAAWANAIQLYANGHSPNPHQQLRLEFHSINYLREYGERVAALDRLYQLQLNYRPYPQELIAIEALIKTLEEQLESLKVNSNY